jgi:hypothetical protein
MVDALVFEHVRRHAAQHAFGRVEGDDPPGVFLVCHRLMRSHGAGSCGRLMLIGGCFAARSAALSSAVAWQGESPS